MSVGDDDGPGPIGRHEQLDDPPRIGRHPHRLPCFAEPLLQ